MNNFVEKYIPETATLTREQIWSIARASISEAYSSWGWDEGVDYPVLALRIGRYIETGNFK